MCSLNNGNLNSYKYSLYQQAEQLDRQYLYIVTSVNLDNNIVLMYQLQSVAVRMNAYPSVEKENGHIFADI